MSEAEFREYLQSRQAPDVNWAARRDEWLADLERLYCMVEGWLDDFAADGVSHERVPRALDEDFLGSYETSAVRIRLGLLVVWLEPVGAHIIGARGRADLKGPGGTTRLVLVPREADRPRVKFRTAETLGPAPSHHAPGQLPAYAWKRATPPPDVEYLELTQDVFLDALMQVANVGPG